MHLSESKIQALKGVEIYGRTQTAHLHQLGLLGPDFVGAHCVWLTDDDIRLMADTGSGIPDNEQFEFAAVVPLVAVVTFTLLAVVSAGETFTLSVTLAPSATL